MNVQWWDVKDALRTRGTAVHISERNGWSSCVRQGEVITVEGVRARVVKRVHAACWEDLPEAWRTEHQGDIPDPVTASKYGLYAVQLVRED